MILPVVAAGHPVLKKPGKEVDLSYPGLTELISDMLKAKRWLLRHNGKIKLSGMARTLREIYKLLNLDGTVFDIYDKPSDAIEAFGSN